MSDEWSIAFGVRRATDGKLHTWQSVEEVKTWNRPPAVDGMMEGIKEWCADWFRFSSGHGTSTPMRFVRGGKPFEGEVHETCYEPDTAMPFTGFRVVTGGDEKLREAEMARRPPRPIEAHILIAEPLTLSPDRPETRSRKGAILKLVEVDPATASVRITLNGSIVKAKTGETVDGVRIKSVTSNKVEIELLSCEVNEP